MRQLSPWALPSSPSCFLPHSSQFILHYQSLSTPLTLWPLSPSILVLFSFLKKLLEYSWFAVVCWFLLFIKVNQLYVTYIVIYATITNSHRLEDSEQHLFGITHFPSVRSPINPPLSQDRPPTLSWGLKTLQPARNRQGLPPESSSKLMQGSPLLQDSCSLSPVLEGLLVSSAYPG